MATAVESVYAFYRLIEGLLSQLFGKVVISAKAKKIFIDRKGIALIYVIHGLHFLISFPFVLYVNAEKCGFVTTFAYISVILLYTFSLLKAIWEFAVEVEPPHYPPAQTKKERQTVAP